MSLSVMSEDDFWQLIGSVKSKTGSGEDDLEDFADELRRRLAKLAPEAILGFHLRLTALEDLAYRWDLWGAAALINGGCSDDGFVYFRRWLIAQGRRAWDAALADPDSLARHIRDGDEAEFEELGYVAQEAFAAVSGSQLELPPRVFPEQPIGSPWVDDDLPKLFPRIAKKVGVS